MTRPNSSHTGKRRRNRARANRAAPPTLSAAARSKLQASLHYVFNNPELLDRAMTHTSAVPGDAARLSGERLEFLGDRVLGLVIASELFNRFEQEREGGLAPRLNALVNKDACARAAIDMGLGGHLILDGAERASGGRLKPSLLADATEAVIGAVYLDGGAEAAEDVILRFWKDSLKRLDKPPVDPKSALQEWAQRGGRHAPIYETAGREGPDHAPVFTSRVLVDGEEPALGKGASKQEAERAAAQALLDLIGIGA